jgi:hypothetical protein
MARLEVKIKANNEKYETLRGTPLSQMDAHHAKTEANHELMATMRASHERINTLMDVSLQTTEVSLEKTEVNREKVETKMEACLEEEEVQTIRAPKD